MKKKLLLLTTAILIAALFQTCGDEKDPTIDVTGLTLSTGASITMTVGDQIPLTATIQPVNATLKDITLTNSDPTVASITDWVLIAHKAGETTITATAGGKTFTCNVTVVDPATAFVAVSDITGVPATAVVGTPLTLTGTVAPTNATNKTIAWSVQSAGTTGANITVGSNTLSTTAAGTVTVRATVVNGATATTNYTKDFTITVSTTAPTFVAVTNITGVPTLATAGTPLTLTGTVAPTNATNKTITWSVQSAGTTGAILSGNTLSTTAAGTVTVRATVVNGATASTNYTKDFTITVSTTAPTFVAVTGITGVPTSATAGTPLTLSGTVTPDNATNKTIAWSVADAGTTGASIAVGSNTLNTTAAGRATVRATVVNGATATTNYTQDFTITVTTTASTFVAVTGITGVPTTATANTPLTLTGTVNPPDATNKTIAWSVASAGTTGANITVGSNILNTTAAGTVTVRATVVNGATATTNYTQDFTITVSATAPTFVAVTGITGVPTTATANTPLTLTGTVNPPDATNKTIAWSVASAGTTGANITVGSNILNTTAAGTVTVRATVVNGATATTNYTQDFTITVTAATPPPTYSISATPATLTFETQQSSHYAQLRAETVTITNTGTGAVTLNPLPAVANYTLTALSSTSLAANATATFTIRPDNRLEVGTYNPTFDVTGSNGVKATISPTFTVNAAASTSTISLDRTTETYHYAVTANFVGVTSNTSWTAESYQTWVTFPSGSSGSAGTINLRYELDVNTSTSSRNATIKVTTTDGSKYAELIITQTGYPSVLTVSPDTLNVPASGGIFSNAFNVTINNSGFWFLVNPFDYDWAHIDGIQNGSNNDPMDFYVVPNTSPTERTATFTVKEEWAGLITSKFTIKQAGAATPLHIPVTGISGVPTTATAGTELVLTGTVAPANATNKTIRWSIVSTNPLFGVATIMYDRLNYWYFLTPIGAGTVTVRATITNGASPTTDYVQNFTITVIP